MSTLPEILHMVVWPLLAGFALWLFRAPLSGLIETLATRLRERPYLEPPPPEEKRP
jgi:hypothetical protein